MEAITEHAESSVRLENILHYKLKLSKGDGRNGIEYYAVAYNTVGGAIDIRSRRIPHDDLGYHSCFSNKHIA